MAEFQLSRIFINQDLTFFSKGDVVFCLYDTVADTIVNRINDIIIFEGDILTVNPLDLSFTRVSTGFGKTILEDGKLFKQSFPEISNFPYHIIKKTEIPDVDPELPEDIRDISLRFISSIFPTSNTASDGTITIEANGTNTPFKYYATDPKDFEFDSSLESGQDTGVFSNLVAGTYTFYAAGFGANEPRLDSISITITLPVNEIPNLTSYGPRWELEYDNLEDTTYKIEILERGYTLPVEVVKGAGVPYGHTMRGEGTDVYDLSILSSNVDVNFLATSFDQFKDIAIADEKKYIVVRSKFNGVTFDEQWTGFCTPQTYRDVLFDPPYSTSISANDRLGDLKGFKFVFGSNSSLNFVRGNLSQLSILHICLQKLSMGFGYRIAVNIFAENHTILNKTPLEQTLVDADTYLNDTATDAVFCDEVVKSILRIYGATLFSWENHWYIVRQEEWLNETINYIEYDSNIVFVESNSWEPRIDLKRPTETNRARFINGAQSRIFTNLYARVNLIQNLDVLDITGNLLNPISKSNLEGGFDRNDLGDPNFIGFDLINKGSNITSKSANDGDSWSLTLSNDKTAISYVETTGKIEYDAIDELEVVFDVNISGNYTASVKVNDYPIYSQLKWSLKLGDNFITRTGQISSTEIINTEFIDAYATNVTIRNVLDMQVNSASGGDDFTLRVFPVDLEENNAVVVSDVNNFIADIIATVKAVPTTGKGVGARFVVFYERNAGDRNFMYFYELVFGAVDEDSREAINPSDQSSDIFGIKVWVRRQLYEAPRPGFQIIDSDGGVHQVPASGWTTTTIINDIKLNYQPAGLNVIPEEIVLTKSGQNENNRELDYPIDQFDLPDLNNGAKIIKNFLKYEDLTPTSLWKIVGGTITKAIQSHRLDFLTKLTKRCRAKVTGNFRTDGLDFAPINVLHDPDDNNRLYLPVGVQSNFKLQEYQGELLEIGSGDDVSISGYTSGFKQDAFR